MRADHQKRHHLFLWCRFPFFHGALGTHIEACTAQDAFALIDFIGHTDVNAAFRAHQRTAAAGDAVVTDEVKLGMFHDSSSVFSCIIAQILCFAMGWYII